ncbi:MAG: double-strand break repair helicase AddA [Alphaproteobacteria bacterium]
MTSEFLWDDRIDGENPSPNLLQATHDQRTAANPLATAWVAASAGTGKTRVLTNRLLALLLEGAEPRQILALTFTKAAAAEMADRVSEALEEWVTLEEPKLRDALYKLAGKPPSEDQLALARRLFAKVLEAPGGLNIQTIHAFAQSLLGRFPVEAGVQPGFKVLEDSEAKALLETTVDRFLAGLIAREDPALSRVFEVMGEDAFRDILAGLIRERGRVQRLRGRNKLEAKVILAPLATRLGLQADDTPQSIRKALAHEGGLPPDLHAALKTYGEWAQAEGTTPNNNNRTVFAAVDWAAQARLEDRLATLGQYDLLFVKSDGGRRKLEKGAFVKKFCEAHPDAIEVILAEQERVYPLVHALRASRQIEISEALLDTAGLVMETYAAAKTAISRVDFDDLILKTIDLLTAEDGSGLWVAYKLDQGLSHVLVDEAQDTNPDQWDIVRGLTDAFYDGTNADREQPRTTFVVGDLKQSIYGFQRADPQVFENMRARFKQDVSQVEGGRWIDPVLNVTFRSSQPVLDAVNLVFTHEQNAKGLTFENQDWPHHLTGRPGAGGLVEVWDQVEAKPEDPNAERVVVRPDDDLDEEDRPEVELAKLLGERISRWLNDPATEEGQEGWLSNHARPMQAEDILVLVRSRSGPFINTLTYTLKQKGVRVAGADRMKLQDQLVIKDLLCLTEYLLQPSADLALATVLRSPLCGFTGEQLYELAYHRGEKETLESALVKAASKGDPTAQAARTLFQTLRAQLASTPYVFYSNLLTRLEAGLRFSGRLGPQATDALKEFLRAALTYERGKTPTIPGFLGWLSKAEIEVKREQEGANGGVRIMTVHGSKGLEAPVVILPHTHRKMDDITRDKLRWYENDEAPAPLPYWKPAKDDSPFQTEELDAHDRARAEEEERRLLYVAMTRAEDRLYICGWKTRGVSDERKAESATWYDTVVNAMSANSDVEKLDPAEGEIAGTRYRLYARSTKADRVPKDKDGSPQSASYSGTRAQRTDETVLSALRAPMPPEPTPPRPFTPSQMLEEPASPSPLAALHKLRGGGQAARGHRSASPFFRGNVLHGLLQRLPEVPESERQAAAKRFLSRVSFDLIPKQIEDWSAEALAITNDPNFADLFSTKSRAEVAVTGIVGELVVSGQIDRLVERDDEVWVVDYKSNRPPPADAAHVPESYRVQLATYKAVLAGLYPGKAIRTFLLWTETPRLMEVPVGDEDLPPSAKS